jgi:putative SOS response-associated peptidase YedK
MCGRYFETGDAEEIAEAFKVDVGSIELQPSYNVAPSHQVPVVRFDAKHGERVLQTVHWGLIPSFATDRRIAWRTINARAETVDTMRSFRTGFAKRRCLVVASGFFEWRKLGKKKYPYAIARADHGLLGLAGLVENWKDPETGEWLRSCTIITTTPNELVAQLHDRMPVIIAPEDYSLWLGEVPSEAAELKALLKPFPAHAMTMWPVSPRMNTPDVNEPDGLVPVPEPTAQGTLPGL